MPRTRRTATPAPEPIVEDEVFEDLDDTDDLDDLDDLEVEPEPVATPKKGRKAAKAAAPAKAAKAPAEPKAEKATGSGFDSTWLAEHVSNSTGKTYDARSIRMLLRKAASEGILEREVGVDRVRYDFPKGANDPTVKAIVAMAKSGAVEKTNSENLAKVKASKAAKAAAAAVEVDEDEDEVEEAPAPKRTRKATTAKAAAPAKAAPATRRRRAAASDE